MKKIYTLSNKNKETFQKSFKVAYSIELIFLFKQTSVCHLTISNFITLNNIWQLTVCERLNGLNVVTKKRSLKVMFFFHWALPAICARWQQLFMAPWIVSLGTASPLSFVSVRSTSCKSPVICPRDCRFQSNCVSCRLREPRPAHDLHALYPPAPAHALRHSARCKFRHKEATFQHLSSLVPVIITNMSILWEN